MRLSTRKEAGRKRLLEILKWDVSRIPGHYALLVGFVLSPITGNNSFKILSMRSILEVMIAMFD